MLLKVLHEGSLSVTRKYRAGGPEECVPSDGLPSQRDPFSPSKHFLQFSPNASALLSAIPCPFS